MKNLTSIAIILIIVVAFSSGLYFSGLGSSLFANSNEDENIDNINIGNWDYISSSEFDSIDINDTNANTLLSIQRQEDFDKGHIVNSINVPYYTSIDPYNGSGIINENLNSQLEQALPNYAAVIIVYGDYDEDCVATADSMLDLGYTNVKVLGGADNWLLSPYYVNLLQSDWQWMTEEELNSAIDTNSHTILDVRAIFNYDEKHVPGAINIDFYYSDITSIVPDYETPVAVYGNFDIDSEDVASQMASAGYTNVYAIGEYWRDMDNVVLGDQ